MAAATMEEQSQASNSADEAYLPLSYPSGHAEDESEVPSTKTGKSSGSKTTTARSALTILGLAVLALALAWSLRGHERLCIIPLLSSVPSRSNEPLQRACIDGAIKSIVDQGNRVSSPEFCVSFYQNVIVDMTRSTSPISLERQQAMFDMIESQVCFGATTAEQIAKGAKQSEAFATHFCKNLDL